MDIKILGVGCPRCKKLEQQVRNVVAENNITADIEKITDVQEMVQYGIMATPGLVINGKVKSSGLTLRDEQILNWIKEESDEIK
jgi:small redox-active disulfide protein 2